MLWVANAELGKDLGKEFVFADGASHSILVRCPGTLYADSRYAVRGRGTFFITLASVFLCVQSTVQSQLSAADAGPAHAAGALVTQ